MCHRGSEINKIMSGHRSQGPATKPPGQSEEVKNWVLFLLESIFFSHLSLSTSMDRGATLQ